jgi:hypothetical protein
VRDVVELRHVELRHVEALDLQPPEVVLLAAPPPEGLAARAGEPCRSSC